MTFPTLRRALWLPGVAVLAAAVGIGSVLGVSVGARAWPWYLGLILAALLAIGWVERLWAARRQKGAAPRARTRLKVIRGGKLDYDLEKDQTTDNQRWLM